MKYKNICVGANTTLFFLSLVLLTRQVPFIEYISILGICVTTLIISLNGNKLFFEKCIIFNGILLFSLLIFALVVGNNLYIAIKYFFILLIIPLAYLSQPKYIFIKIFQTLISIQALLIIVIEVYLLLFFDDANYLELRTFLSDRNWGEIFRPYGILWNIGIRGSALLPFAFMLSFITSTSKFYRAIILIACIFCGNIAYLLSIAIFIFIFYYKSNKKKFYAILFLAMTLLIIFYNNFLNVIEIKNEYSNSIRLEQLNILIWQIFDNFYTPYFGSGLGYNINVLTDSRLYEYDFELIWAYIINQTGFLYSIYFILLNIYLTKKYIKNDFLILAYICYLIYASINPQMLDSNHIIVILLLLSAKEYIFQNSNKVLNGKLRYLHTIQSDKNIF